MLIPSIASLLVLLVSSLSFTSAASSWGFNDATLSVTAKGSGVGSGLKEKLVINKPISKIVNLAEGDNLKILLTTQDGKTAKRAHQTFLKLKDSATGLETSFPFIVKDSGKGKVELTQKDIPAALLTTSKPLSASIVVASFGSSIPYDNTAFQVAVERDANGPSDTSDKPLRYGKLPEIHHIFKADPKSPPKIISLFFTAIVLAALPALLIAWFSLGANVNHLSKALGNSPVSHTLFFGSVAAMEGLFFLYYTSWNLFQVLPVAGAISLVIFLSGTRALTEVQGRRVAGLR